MTHRLLLLAALLPACVRAQNLLPHMRPARTTELRTPIVDVPLIKSGDFYFADVRVNGRPFRFTIETGANFFGIGAHVARALGLSVDTVDTPGGPGGDKSEFAALDSLSIGGVTLRGLSARVSPMFDGSAFVGDGIISLIAWRELLATLDFGRARLRFEKGSLPATNGKDVLPIVGQDRAGRIDVPLQIGAVTVPAVLDSRSFIWLVLPDSLDAQIPVGAPPRSIGGARGPSLGSFRLRGARATGDARIGDVVIRTPAISFRDRPGAVLGIPLLEQLVITIDQTNRRVRVARADQTPVVVPIQEWEQNTASTPGPRIVEGAAPPPPVAGQRTMGFNLAGTPGGSLFVRAVAAGSGAARVGLKDGDELAEFDGTPAAAMNPAVFRAAAAKTVPIKVIVIRGGQRVELMIEQYVVPGG